MESEKRPYETKTASICFEEMQMARQGGIYQGPNIDKVIKVNSTQKAEFEEVFEGLFKLKEIPQFVILQSPNGYTLVQVNVVKNEEKTQGNTAASPFRPRRKKLQKSGKKSGKVRKNKKSKKSRN